MVSKVQLVAAAGIFAGLSLGFEGYCTSFARAVRTALAIRTGQLADLEGSAQRTQGRVTALRADIAALRSNHQGGGTAGVSATDLLAMIATNPQQTDRYLNFFRAYTARRFAWMYPILGFSQAQIDKFEELRTEREGDKIDIERAALSMGLDPSDPGPAALEKEHVEQFLSATASLEGPEAAQKLDDFFRMESVGPWIDYLNSMTGIDSEPFTNTQTGQLYQILANSSPSYKNGKRADPDEIDWAEASAQAATVFSGSQLQVFNATAQEAHVKQLIRQFYSQQQAAPNER